jgi:hypothetical protein
MKNMLTERHDILLDFYVILARECRYSLNRVDSLVILGANLYVAQV